MDLKRFIYEFNLVSTDTVKDRYEWANILNNNIDMNVNYKDCISLYHLVDSFNKLYLRFKKEQLCLPELKINCDMGLVRYYSNKNNNYERLVIFVDNYNDKKFINGEGILYLCQDHGIYKCYLTNGLLTYDEGLCKKFLSLSDEDIKKYLEFGSKYDILIGGYNYFKNRQIFGNETSMIFTKIKGNLFNESYTFEISLGNASMNCEDYINIIFKLGDKLEIDYDNSIVKLSGEIIRDKFMIIDQFVKNIYVNKNVVLSTDDIGYEKVNSNIKKMLPNS